MANKIYTAPETAITFLASGGTVTFTPTSLANGAGRVSAQHDRGASSRATRFEWRAYCKAAAALTAGVALEIYLATSDGSKVDGNVGTADAAVSDANKRYNLLPIGAIVADSTTNGEVQHASGIIEVSARFLSVVWWNAFGQALTGTAGDHGFSLMPMPYEVQ